MKGWRRLKKTTRDLVRKQSKVPTWLDRIKTTKIDSDESITDSTATEMDIEDKRKKRRCSFCVLSTTTLLLQGLETEECTEQKETKEIDLECLKST